MANQWGIPKEVEEAVLKRDLRCVYCGCEFGDERAKKRSWEHIINDVAIATMENIVLCCVGCNASKGAKLLRPWLRVCRILCKRTVHRRRKLAYP